MRTIAVFFLTVIFCSGLMAGEADRNIKRMFDQNDVKYSINSGGDFQLKFTDGNTVIISSDTETYKEITIREIRVIVGGSGKNKTDLLYKMLRENSNTKIGAYSIREHRGKNFVIYSVKISSKASWDELWGAVLFCSDMELPTED
jgi:hypothetical protein